MDKTKKFEAVVKYLKNEIDYNQLGDELLGGKDIDFFNHDNDQKYKQEKMKLLKDPEFYKKCGYEVEFVRKNKEEPKLTKYFLVKYFND